MRSKKESVGTGPGSAELWVTCMNEVCEVLPEWLRTNLADSLGLVQECLDGSEEALIQLVHLVRKPLAGMEPFKSEAETNWALRAMNVKVKLERAVRQHERAIVAELVPLFDHWVRDHGVQGPVAGDARDFLDEENSALTPAGVTRLLCRWLDVQAQTLMVKDLRS